MQWSFDLVQTGDGHVAKVNFVKPDGEIVLHVDYRRAAGQVIACRRVGGQWQVQVPVPVVDELPERLALDVVAEGEGPVCLRCAGGELVVPWAMVADLAASEIRFEGRARPRESEAERLATLRGWRLWDRPSGFPAENATLDRRQADPALLPGLSVILRAKNEAGTIGPCLESIAGLTDEIIFADNGSSDGTGLIAERLKARIFELRTFSYPVEIPRAGEAHAREVLSMGSNTLGHFYNWTLARAGRSNFMKWDADYVALRPALSDMIATHDLRTRSDNFVLWFSGLEVYSDGTRFWVDTDSVHNEFRCFSLRHGHRWVNLPPWEEVDQRALFRAQKLFWTRPVYLELFRLDRDEFRDRGIVTADTRDRERVEAQRHWRETGGMPARYREVSGLDDPVLHDLPVSPRELELAAYFDRQYRSLPTIRTHATGTEQRAGDLPQNDLAVFVISCEKYSTKQQVIRDTWGADLRRLGIPFYFVVGRPGQGNRIVGDILYVDCPDTYEFLATKVVTAFEFSLAKLNVEHVLKIDDDCVFHAYRFLRADYAGRDFTGGGLSGGAHAQIDWHAGKCQNTQLDTVPFSFAPGATWVGGQFGYVVSRRAREALVAEKARVCASLYEDYVMSQVLAEHGMPFVQPFGPVRSVRHYEAWHEESICLVADVPGVEEMVRVYDVFVGRKAGDRAAWHFAETCSVTWDWMDFAAVRRDLGL